MIKTDDQQLNQQQLINYYNNNPSKKYFSFLFDRSIIDNFRISRNTINLLPNHSISSLMSSSILFPTNQYTTSSKSSQEIQKLMIPDDIPPSEVIPYLLNKNHPLQMPFVYKNFHKHFQGVISTICQKAVIEQPQNQILICQSLKIILEKEKNISLHDLDEIFKMTVECLNNLNSLANEPLAEILQLLLRVHPSRQSLLNKLQTQILQLGKATQPTISKVTSGRLISIVSKQIGKMMIKGQMIDILKRILTDNQIEARKVWVGQIFPKLLQRLELDFVELHLQQKIYECVYDQNQQIGVMSLRVILKNINRFSIEQQSSRIVKLFIDSLTSKNQRICLMVTELMGQVYQKLINIIMKSEANCTRFWRSLVELAQCKNERILNNLIYNLPGILLLSSKFHKTDPLVDIYCELFYQPLTNKVTLMSFFHQIVFLYPHKKNELKQVIYWIFGQLFDEQEQDYDIEAIKIINSFVKNIFKSRVVFFATSANHQKENSSLMSYDENSNRQPKETTSSQKSLSTNVSKLYNDQVDMIVPNGLSTEVHEFEMQFCEFLFKYLQLLQFHKNGQWLNLFFASIKEVAQYFPLEFVERQLLPKIYSSVKSKTGPIQQMIEIIVILLRRDIYNLMNFYASKIHVQFSKSARSHQRQAAIQFLYFSSFYFSIQTFQEYKLGEKFLYFNSDKALANKFLFIRYLERIQYFLTRQEKIQMAIVVSRLMKDNDPEVTEILAEMDYTEKQDIRQLISEQSKSLKQKERLQAAVPQYIQPNKSLKPLVNNHRRESKQLKKEEILKKRIQTTKSKTKMLIKQVPKKKTLNFTTTGPTPLQSSLNKTQNGFKKNS